VLRRVFRKLEGGERAKATKQRNSEAAKRASFEEGYIHF